MTSPDRGGPLTLTRVLALLAVIVALAFVLPYVAVRTLHVRRLQAADDVTRSLADRVSEALRSDAAVLPAGTQVLSGPGDRPRSPDERWIAVALLPLSRLLPTDPAVPQDPWGNAYLVRLDAGGRRPVWVVSAGPDGVLQTPFAGSVERASGDDRLARSK